MPTEQTAAIEEMFTMDPLICARITGTTCLQARKSP